MAEVTYFVVQGFEWTPSGHYQALEPVQASGRAQAVRQAQTLALRGGAIAFSRTGDPESGEFADAFILGIYGSVPPEFLAAA